MEARQIAVVGPVVLLAFGDAFMVVDAGMIVYQSKRFSRALRAFGAWINA